MFDRNAKLWRYVSDTLARFGIEKIGECRERWGCFGGLAGFHVVSPLALARVERAAMTTG